MSEVSQTEQTFQNKQNIESYIAERVGWMADAVEVLGERRDSDPLQVFVPATEIRDDAVALVISDEQAKKLREVAGRFGIGGEVDVKSAASHQILEGGKPWKIEAEAQITDEAQTILFAGSPFRMLGQDELDYLKTRLPEGVKPAADEFGMSRQIAELQDGFQALEEDAVLPFGYDIENSHALVKEATGQLVRIGKIGDANVVMFRVDRENYVDEEGANKYRNQPDSAALLKIIGKVLSACGDEQSSVGINSSTTYASRAVDTVRAGLSNGREFKVGMYGRQTLADIKGEPIAAPTGINQIPGELHTMQEKLSQLQAELA